MRATFSHLQREKPKHSRTFPKMDKVGFLTIHLILKLLIVNLLFLHSQIAISEAMPYETDCPLYIGSRPLGMGNAYVGLVDGAEAGFWNPAGLIQDQGVRIFVYGKLLDRKENVLDSKSVAFCYRDTALFWGNKIAFRLKNNDTQDYNYYSLAQKLNSYIAFGLSAKFKRRHPSDHYQFFGYKTDYDIGVLVKPDVDSSFGVLVQKLDGKEHIINAVTFGSSHRFNERALSVFDINILHNNNLSFEFHLGWEYIIRDQLMLRIGLANKTPTAGIGIKISNFQFDYATINRLSFLSAQVKL